MSQSEVVENRTFNEIAIGEKASLTWTLTPERIALFAAVAGGPEPAVAGPANADGAAASRVLAQGVSGSALVTALLGYRLPGPGTIYRRQDLRFERPLYLGDALTVTIAVRKKHPEGGIVVFDCLGVDQGGEPVFVGSAEVVAPVEKISARQQKLPDVQFRRHDKYERLIAACRGLEPIPTAVAYPCDESSLAAAVDAARAGLIAPTLVGPADRIRAAAERHGLDVSACDIVEAPHSRAAAERAVELVRAGAAEVLMKGSLHTDELMGAVVRKDTGLRTARRISHCFVMDVPTYAKPLIITDAAINIFPTLEDKVDIVQNAIELAQVLGAAQPLVAVLSAVETVNPKIPSTVEAAALCKMADRGQIRGGLLDGPLALDNAISEEAARIKGISSPVAGRADILLVPDLEAGNMLAKNLTFLSAADAAGVVLGARVPIVLTSRADSVRTRMASCAVAALCAQARRRAPATIAAE